MRKVLLRIIFDNLWHCESVGNELWVGYGWILSLWALIAVVSLGLLWKATKSSRELVSSLIFWAIVPTAIAMIPVLGLPIAKSGIPLFGYGTMLTIGFLSATYLASRRAKSVGLNPEVIFDLMMWILLPGIIGARIVYLLQYGDRVFAQKQGFEIVKAAVALWDGGIVFYGCIIGGVVGLLIFCRRRKIRPMQLGDVLMPSLFIGLGFGRIGCFLYGCCFGAACSLPWAVHFPSDSLTFERLAARSEMNHQKLLEANGIPIATSEISNIEADAVLTTMALHPTQLYSSVLAFMLAWFLIWFFRRRPFEGAVLALGWTLYPINRFVLEIIRDDEPGRMNTGLTFSQLMSIGLFVSGCLLFFYLQKTQNSFRNNATNKVND